MAGLDRDELTAEVQREILRSVAMGAFLAPACRAAGVAPSMLRGWREKVRRGDDDAEEDAAFFAAIAVAKAAAEEGAVAMILSKGGNQGAAWWLSRRHPKRWAREFPGRAWPRDEDGNEIDI